MYTVEGSSKASIHIRSSPGTCAAPALARLIAPPVAIDVPILKVWPRSLELAAVTSAKERLTKATFGIATPLNGFAESGPFTAMRSEEHTSELQSRRDLVCRLLLEKKNEI